MLLSPEARQRLLSGLLRPIASFCLRRSVGLPEILNQLKFELVRSAEQEITKQQGKRSVSAIAAMTGITRREVHRVLTQQEKDYPRPNIAGRVLVQWNSDSRYCSKSGAPRTLSFGRDNSEFTKLVRTVSKDTSPGAILFELRRLGAVLETKAGLKLVQTEAMYKTDPIKAAGLIMRNVASLVASGEENIDPDQTVRNLFLRTEFDHIAENDLPRIKQWLLKQGAEFHAQLRDFLGKYDRDLNPALNELPHDKRRKVVVGSFSVVSESVENSSNL